MTIQDFLAAKVPERDSMPLMRALATGHPLTFGITVASPMMSYSGVTTSFEDAALE